MPNRGQKGAERSRGYPVAGRVPSSQEGTELSGRRRVARSAPNGQKRKERPKRKTRGGFESIKADKKKTNDNESASS